MRKMEEFTAPIGMAKLADWVGKGYSQREIAHIMGVSEQTLTRWKQKSPAIERALRRGGSGADVLAEGRLFELAMGQNYQEQQACKVKSVRVDEAKRRQEEEEIQLVMVEKQRAPSVSALEFWLKNRRPEYWQSAPEDEREGEDLPAIEVRVLE